jgi:GT2 family glycosyltransferase
VVFLDDDCEAEQGWLEALMTPLRRDSQVLGVAGAVLVRDCGPIGFAENILGFPGGGLRYLDAARGELAVPTCHLSTCNCAYRREVVLRAGGFSEDARFGAEDSLLAENVSALGPCLYTPYAVVYHQPRNQIRAVLAWFTRRGQSEIGFLWATPNPGASVWYLLRSSWMLRLLAALAVLTQYPRLALFVAPAFCAHYALLLWRFRYARAYSTHRRAWWLVPAVKYIMDLGSELGRWKALVACAIPKRWGP